MQSPWLILNGTTYALSDIKQRKFSLLPKNSVLEFCYDWLNEKNEFILQTSGSTGIPKTISASRSQLKASAQRTISFLQLTEGCTSLICLDTRYIAGIMMLIRSMEAGMNMYVIEPSANPFEKIPNDLVIDFTALVPYQLDTVLRSVHKIKLDKIKIVLIGGAPLSGQLKKELKSFSGAFYATYGMTETLSHVALQKLNGENPQESFRLLPGISGHVDQRGCLVISAPHISPTHIVTNDLVEFISTDQFTWLGRIDHVINSGGVKVIPEKIESVIAVLMNEMKLSNRFFVAGLPDPSLGEMITLIIEGDKPHHNNEKIILQRLKGELGKFEVPKSIRYVSKFMQTDTGKINKSKTLELF